MKSPVLRTVRAGAAFLGLTEKAVRARISRGQLPIVRIGGSIYLPDLEHWIAEHTRAASPASARPAPAANPLHDPALDAIADLLPTTRVF